MDNSESIPEPTVNFGSRKSTKGSKGGTEESPGHFEEKFTKGTTGKDKDTLAGALDVLPPFSKAKIKSSGLKIKGDA